MSKMLDYISGKSNGDVAMLEASLEHTSGYLGFEIAEGQKLRCALTQIEDVCTANLAADAADFRMALDFVRQVAAKALTVYPNQSIPVQD